MTAAVREAGPAELAAWDKDAVWAPGGHVYQSTAWARHTAKRGWTPRFLLAGDARALVLTRKWPVIGGGSAYCVRGPVAAARPWTGDGSGAATGEALAAVAAWLGERGVDVLAADAEVAASDAGYLAAIGAAGFRAVPELQPSRHRMALDLPAGGDAAAVMSGVGKSTRQRIRQAERSITVLRWDAATSVIDGVQPATEPAAEAFARFFALLRATGDRLGFDFAGPDEFVPWWEAAMADRMLSYLEAREGGPDGDVLGGLLLYRHGTRLSTQHSADRADRRRDHAGTMHLLRWRAIQLALAEGCDEMDLGGVDVAGARRPPVAGEPTFGLYEHKRSFGAHWVELAGARERVARPWRYAAGRVTARLARAARR
jgi:lipid II:glycine glycyltransferase (peptidoglycan interpeptide bridge formation enzyme)